MKRDRHPRREIRSIIPVLREQGRLMPATKQFRSLAALGAFQMLFASPAQASSVAFANGHILMMFQAAGAPNQCVSFNYDKNGNITTRVNQSFGAGATWGASLFGCFSWTAS